MRRKYGDCQRADGDCTACSLVSYGRDCRNKPITKLEWQRRMAQMSIKELAEKSGVSVEKHSLIFYGVCKRCRDKNNI